jgi:hypothetical protein
MAERNSELVDIRDGTPPTPSVPRLARSGFVARRRLRPAFVFVRRWKAGAAS